MVKGDMTQCRSCVDRGGILKMDSKDGRSVSIRVSHVGIDVHSVTTALGAGDVVAASEITAKRCVLACV